MSDFEWLGYVDKITIGNVYYIKNIKQWPEMLTLESFDTVWAFITLYRYLGIIRPSVFLWIKVTNFFMVGYMWELF